ncbi:conserved exported hypothetical protein [Burkholderia sp. 8Y]|uniref:hypothetical protein n=1 Tax=Burkholderia sp. 8Y TaxID=2653133 RepID=UPI0012EF3046|nr:hypothetical protein [Burkholderia sp. 8Y]VXC45096.1 conserved exported hypothetical protein [Burkholderia sp. 8Y]
MKKTLSCFALSLLSFATHAAPLQWNPVPVPSGNNYGNYYGQGQSTSTTQMIGDMAYTQQNYTDDQGYQRTRNCYSQQVGNQILTRCD